MSDNDYDVMIVGAGPAGLSAALVLGRSRERVLVLDDGQPRNKRAQHSHGFYSRDGVSPEQLRREALEQLEPYKVRVESAHVTSVQRTAEGFEVASEHQRWHGRKVLVATGMQEHDSDIRGIADNIGAGVFCCPYCDGWELQNLALGGLATGPGADEYALALLSWSDRVTLFTNGVAPLTDPEREKLRRNGVRLCDQPIDRVLGGAECRLRGVQLMDGSVVEVDALFLHAGAYQHSPLARAAGCEMKEPDTVKTYGPQKTNVEGLYVAGDAAAHVSSIAVAAADGYRAALAIHTELRRERTAARTAANDCRQDQ
jgi:thioredoxin reductase